MAPLAAAVMETNGYGSSLAYSELEAVDDQEIERISKLAGEHRDRLRDAGLVVLQHFSEGQLRKEIVAEAERCHADILFVGDENHGLIEEFFVGSMTSAVLTHAHCAVEIVRTKSNQAGNL